LKEKSVKTEEKMECVENIVEQAEEKNINIEEKISENNIKNIHEHTKNQKLSSIAHLIFIGNTKHEIPCQIVTIN
jgi:hypothetical protein